MTRSESQARISRSKTANILGAVRHQKGGPQGHPAGGVALVVVVDLLLLYHQLLRVDELRSDQHGGVNLEQAAGTPGGGGVARYWCGRGISQQQKNYQPAGNRGMKQRTLKHDGLTF